MRKAKLLVAAVMMAMGVSASAQLTKDFTGWTRVELSFATQRWREKVGTVSSSMADSQHGIAVGLMKGISISKNIPLFLDLGGRLSWTHQCEDVYYYGKDKTNYLNLSIPVNGAYRLSFSKVDLTPFFGPNFNFTLMAKKKYASGSEYNILKGDDVRFFQFGLNTGVGITFVKKVYLGYTFQPDLTSFFKGVETSGDKLKVQYDVKEKKINHFITVGYNF